MKRVLLFLCFSLQIIIVSAQENKIDGKWTGIDDHGDSAIIVFSGSSAYMEFQGEKGSPFDYKIDYSKNPIYMDLIMKNEDEEEIIPALLKFLDSNTIKWELFPYATSRPIKFSSESNEINETTMILTRVK